MKRHAVVCLLILSGCATATAARSDTDALQSTLQGVTGDSGMPSGPVRLETPAGTFLVHPNNAEDFGRLLAGEPTQHQYLSITDVP